MVQNEFEVSDWINRLAEELNILAQFSRVKTNQITILIGLHFSV